MGLTGDDYERLIRDQPRGPSRIHLADVHDFILDQEPHQAEPILGEPQDTLLSRSGLLLVGGPAGVGKTTFVVDQAVHLATGTDWFGIPVPHPVRVVLIETEGSRQKFREKLEAKLEGWPGPSPAAGMLRVADQPWGPLDLANDDMRRDLADLIADADVVMGDPVAKLGLRGVGSPEDVATLVGHLYDLGLFSGGPAWVLLHHLKHNRLGADLLEQLSGVWDRDPDTILVLKRGESSDEVRLHWGKVRHGDAAKWLAHPWTLKYAPGLAFEVVATGPHQRDPEQWQRLRALAVDLLAQSAALGVTIAEYRTAAGSADDSIGDQKAQAVLDELVGDDLAERREKVPGRKANAKPYFLLPRKGSEGAEGAEGADDSLAPAPLLPPPPCIGGEGEGADRAVSDTTFRSAPSGDPLDRLRDLLGERVANHRMSQAAAEAMWERAEQLIGSPQLGLLVGALEEGE